MERLREGKASTEIILNLNKKNSFGGMSYFCLSFSYIMYHSVVVMFVYDSKKKKNKIYTQTAQLNESIWTAYVHLGYHRDMWA